MSTDERVCEVPRMTPDHVTLAERGFRDECECSLCNDGIHAQEIASVVRALSSGRYAMHDTKTQVAISKEDLLEVRAIARDLMLADDECDRAQASHLNDFTNGWLSTDTPLSEQTKEER